MKTTEVNCSCKLYIRVGYLCKHSFFCLSICGIQKIPRNQLQNRWLKNAEERFSSLQLGELTDACEKEQRLQSKTKDCWFGFQSCLSDVSCDESLIDIVLEGITELRKKVQDLKKGGSKRLKDDFIEQLLGSKAVDNVTVFPPNQGNNKGCRKRLISSAEKTSGSNKRQKRACKFCGQQAFHDSRNCPVKTGQNTQLPCHNKS